MFHRHPKEKQGTWEKKPVQGFAKHSYSETPINQLLEQYQYFSFSLSLKLTFKWLLCFSFYQRSLHLNWEVQRPTGTLTTRWNPQYFYSTPVFCTCSSHSRSVSPFFCVFPQSFINVTNLTSALSPLFLVYSPGSIIFSVRRQMRRRTWASAAETWNIRLVRLKRFMTCSANIKVRILKNSVLNDSVTSLVRCGNIKYILLLQGLEFCEIQKLLSQKYNGKHTVYLFSAKQTVICWTEKSVNDWAFALIPLATAVCFHAKKLEVCSLLPNIFDSVCANFS